MSRSLKKGPYIDERLQLKAIKAASSGSRQAIKTWARAAVVTPEMVGISFAVHNGKEHIPVFIVEDMVGHRLGEFASTRKFRRHGGKIAKEQEKGNK